jgi:acyl-coenzyme A synthetase/AMP-(fatty) acid ligase
MVIDELEVVPEMPRTSSGKIDRGTLAARYMAQHRSITEAVTPAQVQRSA